MPYPILAAIGDLPEEAIGQSLQRLQAAELLYETSPAPEAEYTFKRALTREVAHASLAHGKRALHARILAVMETLYADRLEEHIDRLAHHAFQSHLWDQQIRSFHAETSAQAPNLELKRLDCFTVQMRRFQEDAAPDTDDERRDPSTLRSYASQRNRPSPLRSGADEAVTTTVLGKGPRLVRRRGLGSRPAPLQPHRRLYLTRIYRER